MSYPRRARALAVALFLGAGAIAAAGAARAADAPATPLTVTKTGYYTSMSEELFIERDINWLRLRDLQVSYALPEGLLGSRSASVFVKGTDLFLWTNYTGLDPIVNGNSAAVGGSGAVGIDFGNFPMPRGVNFGIRMGF